ncbi:MAG: efflux RND transporter periplasmic adaptor subunit [Chloroflexi bacterium]|nr:efflux RND transporter periplasmic adaptor subunit [Chloroflexota bacterium]
MKLKRLVPILLVIAVLAAGGYWLYRTRLAPKPAATASSSYTQVTEVKQGNLTSSLSVVGQLAAVQQTDLTFERMNDTSKLLTLAVKAGNTVTVGQVLATIDPASYQQALDQARSDLQAAEEKLADLKTPATELQIAKADQTIAKAENTLQQAKEDLATLQAPDFSSLQDAVANAQDSLTQAQLQQTLAERDATAKSVRDLQYAVGWHERRINELQTLVAEGKANLEQINLLATEKDALSQAQVDLALAQSRRQAALQLAAAKVTAARETLADAQDALATSQAGGDKLALAKARLAVRDAEVSLASVKDDRVTLTEGADATTLAAAQADLDKKRLAVTDAEADLAGTKLTAPFSGTILQTNTTPGNLIAANTKILTVADLKGLEVVASIDETTIKRVTQGQTAQVTFDALPGQTLRGQVGEVPLQGALQGGVMVYQVPISLTGAEKLPLLVGMTANVKIQLGQAQNALLVPTLAITRGSSGYQVLVPNATDPQGAPTAVPVEVGLSDGVNTQIVRGLNLGDKVRL